MYNFSIFHSEQHDIKTHVSESVSVYQQAHNQPLVKGGLISFIKINYH